MLRFGMLSLICALCSGVYGFGEHAPASWPALPGLCFVFLGLSALGFWGGTMNNPSINRESQFDSRSTYGRSEADATDM